MGEVVTERLCKCRREAGMTHRDLANILSCAESTISGYETGRNAIPTQILLKFCEIFNVTADYLLGVTDLPVSSDSITEYTGLTLDMLEKLHILNSEDGMLKKVESCINRLCAEIESERIDRIIGMNIREQRERQGYSLKQMSKAVGVSISALHAYEAGVRRVKLTPMLKISSFLGKDIAWFGHLHTVQIK